MAGKRPDSQGERETNRTSYSDASPPDGARRLSAEDAALYREWIANRRQLEAVLEQMRDLSREAGEYILAAKGLPFQGPARPRPQRRSAT